MNGSSTAFRERSNNLKAAKTAGPYDQVNKTAIHADTVLPPVESHTRQWSNYYPRNEQDNPYKEQTFGEEVWRIVLAFRQHG